MVCQVVQHEGRVAAKAAAPQGVAEEMLRWQSTTQISRHCSMVDTPCR
jgi:hypothetical protein